MDRIVAQLLTDIDSLQYSSALFIIDATNRPDLFDPSLMRPGRFDKLIYLGVTNDKEGQLKILQTLTRKFNLADCDLRDIAEECNGGFTGADLCALCSSALSAAYQVKHLRSMSC